MIVLDKKGADQSAQSGQHLCDLLAGNYNILTCFMCYLCSLSHLCSLVDWLESYSAKTLNKDILA